MDGNLFGKKLGWFNSEEAFRIFPIENGNSLIAGGTSSSMVTSSIINILALKLLVIKD